MSVIHCFSRRFCVSLQKSVAENAESYRDGTIGSLLNDSLDDAGTQIETEFRIDPTLVLAPPTGGSGELLGDAENAIRLHRALSSLTPLQASDERLWAWLCHIPFRDYVAQRHLGGSVRREVGEQNSFSVFRSWKGFESLDAQCVGAIVVGRPSHLRQGSRGSI